MDKKTEALKLALEALITASGHVNNEAFVKVMMARDALVEALAEQPRAEGTLAQQEPVAWVRNLTDPQPHCVTALNYMSVADADAGVQYTPLYTPPQPAQEPLTPAQKIALAEDWFAEDWAITKAVGMMVEYEMRIAHGITKGTK